MSAINNFIDWFMPKVPVTEWIAVSDDWIPSMNKEIGIKVSKKEGAEIKKATIIAISPSDKVTVKWSDGNISAYKKLAFGNLHKYCK